ncbi:MAG: FMN-binding protein [Pseudomonadota bacterium]
MDRRIFNKFLALLPVGLLVPSTIVQARTYLTVEQARQVLWGDMPMQPVDVMLTKAQMKSIRSSSKTRVRSNKVKAWKTENGGWFIIDQVIGKHENIDIAVALTYEGKVQGIEVLVYRETYGHEIRNAKWRAQFTGKTHHEVLKLDKQIKNISGATLSCRHITDGINRLTHTWDQILRYL